jgi:hypothetical protein
VPGVSLYSTQYATGNWNPVTDPIYNVHAVADPNTDAAVAARGYALGNMPRVTGEARMQAYKDEDFNLLKRTRFSESTDLLFQVSVLNAFNRVIWNRPNLDPRAGNPLGSQFGIVDWGTYSTTGGGGYLLGPRKIQLQLKFEF